MAPRAANDDERAVYLDEISKALASFSQVSTVKTTTSLWPLETPVHAQEDCGCLKTSVQEPAYRYFCGVGTDQTLSVARGKASEKAFKTAAKALAPKGSKDNSSLQSYLERVATQVDSCVEPGRKQPTFSVMIRVPDSLTDARAQEAFVPPAESDVANAHGQIALPAGLRRALEVKVSASPPSSGEFVVRLTPLAGRGQVGYTVSEIEAVQDGSNGSRRWEFVFIANTTAVGKLSSHEYKDGTDRIVRFAAAESPTIVLPSTPLHLTILGFRR